MAVTVLRRGGFQMLEASNGREALERMRSADPDLVVMDLMMPQVTGWDVLRERAGDPFLKRIPVIVVTAKDLTEEDRQRLAQSAERVIVKQALRVDELRSEIRGVLSARRTLRRVRPPGRRGSAPCRASELWRRPARPSRGAPFP